MMTSDMPFEVTPLGQAIPLHCIGESHCLSFSDQIFQLPTLDQVWQTRVHFLKHLKAFDYVSAERLISVDFLSALKAQGLIDAEGKAVHASTGEESAFHIIGRPVLAPVMLLFAGDLDLFERLFRQIGDEHDFELPGDTVYGFDENRQALPFAMLEMRLNEIFTPFVAVLRHLVSIGFNRLFVQALPPRSADEARMEKWLGRTGTSRALRAKITAAANRLLEKACAEIGVGFVNMQAHVTTDGYTTPKYDLDGVHLGRDTVPFALAELFAQLVDRSFARENHTRHDLLRSFAATRPLEINPLSSWLTKGFVASQPEIGALQSAIRGCAFAPADGHALAHPDWAGWSRKGRAGCELAGLDSDRLEQIRAALVVPAVQESLHDGSRTELTASNCRLVRLSHDGALERGHSWLPAPARTRRCHIQLDGQATLVLAALNGSEPEYRIEAGPGQMLVYDPQRLRLHLACENGPVTALELALIGRLKHQPFRLIASGLNDWPLDPFHYTVAGHESAPPLGTPYVHERVAKV